MRPLLTLPYLNVYLHDGPVPVLELQWLRYAASADFQAAALQALHLSQQHHAQAWVADDRHLGTVRPRDLDWAEQAILTPLAEGGLQRFAQLEPLDSLNRHIISGMYTRKQPELPFEFRTFDNLDQARLWAADGV